ncbi:MAG TPA: TadE family protein [Beijerinckiaceae bacterium]|nr:TadE family protein [Beijerinckiaceae bacterium]
MQPIDRLRRLGDRLLRDTRGAISMPLALAMPVLFGFGMLVIDGSRYYSLQTSLQAGADALALAGAAELDGRDDAITRANRAIDNLVANDQRFGEGTSAISRGGIAVRYLGSLPATDAEAITAAHVTTDPSRAGFVEVRVQPVTMRNLFAAAAGAVGTTAQTAAAAVAGFDSVACDIAPLFICNPFEGTGTSVWHGAKDPGFRRRLIAMKEKGADYFPANRGYLKSPSGKSSGSELKEALAIDHPRECYRSSKVELRPGTVSSTAEAMNVRFDLYEGAFKKYGSDPDYRPAVNVRKGYTGAGCGQTAAYDPTLSPTDPANQDKPLGFPRDPCFYTDSCTYGGASMGGRIGGGDWDFETYWKASHPGRSFPNGWKNTDENRPSRYEVYRYEIDNDLVGDLSVGGGGGGKKGGGGGAQESGTPQCYSGDKTKLTDNPDRRTFVAAILDCVSLGQQYDIKGGSSPPLPVTTFARFFLTEAVDKKEGTFMVELVELVEPGTAAARNVIRDSVQLVR